MVFVICLRSNITNLQHTYSKINPRRQARRSDRLRLHHGRLGALEIVSGFASGTKLKPFHVTENDGNGTENDGHINSEIPLNSQALPTSRVSPVSLMVVKVFQRTRAGYSWLTALCFLGICTAFLSRFQKTTRRCYFTSLLTLWCSNHKILEIKRLHPCPHRNRSSAQDSTCSSMHQILKLRKMSIALLAGSVSKYIKIKI